MRKLILQEFLTLDGFAADPKGETDFVPASMQGDHRFLESQIALMNQIDILLLGAKTYQMFASYWPNVTEGDEKPFADKMNATDKVVVSRSLKRAPWGEKGDARLVRDDLVGEVTRMKGEAGNHILIWGSISLTQQLAKAGLIDEYRLVMCPLTLGDGRGLFDEAMELRLLDATPFDQGALSLRYVPKAATARPVEKDQASSEVSPASAS